jgi:hypothetical protein
MAGSQGSQQLLHDAADKLQGQLLICSCQHSSQVRATQLLAQVHTAPTDCHIKEGDYVGVLHLLQRCEFPCYCLWHWGARFWEV